MAVLGEVFKVDTMETKTGKIILTFFITDYTDSITVKCFLKPQEKEEVLNNIKKVFIVRSEVKQYMIHMLEKLSSWDVIS